MTHTHPLAAAKSSMPALVSFRISPFPVPHCFRPLLLPPYFPARSHSVLHDTPIGFDSIPFHSVAYSNSNILSPLPPPLAPAPCPLLVSVSWFRRDLSDLLAAPSCPSQFASISPPKAPSLSVFSSNNQYTLYVRDLQNCRWL